MPETTLWGVGKLGPGRLDLSAGDFESDTAFAQEVFSTFGIGRGDLVVFILPGSEIPHMAPLEEAVTRLGGYFCSAEAMGPDAFRTAFLIRELPVKAVVGVSSEVVEALRAQGEDLRELFAAPLVVLARPGAYEALSELGLEPHRFFVVGPTVALECQWRRGAHLNASEWLVEQHPDGELVVSTQGRRAGHVTDVPTGIRGALITEPCPCGSPPPRLEPAAPS